MTTALRLLALLFFLVALLTGGCSLLFTVLVFTDPAGDAIAPIVVLGLGIGGLSLWAGLALWRKTRKSVPPPPPDTFR
jgi:hypothetical protein